MDNLFLNIIKPLDEDDRLTYRIRRRLELQVINPFNKKKSISLNLHDAIFVEEDFIYNRKEFKTGLDYLKNKANRLPDTDVFNAKIRIYTYGEQNILCEVTLRHHQKEDVGTIRITRNEKNLSALRHLIAIQSKS